MSITSMWCLQVKQSFLKGFTIILESKGVGVSEPSNDQFQRGSSYSSPSTTHWARVMLYKALDLLALRSKPIKHFL